MSAPVSNVLIRPRLAGLMGHHVTRCWPVEGCGLILGRPEEGAGNWRVTQVIPARNVAPDRARGFEVSPAVRFAVERTLRTNNGKEHLLGHFHSHPDGPPEPSARDAARATDEPHLVWLILSVTETGGVVLGGWRWTGDAFAPVNVAFG